MKSVSDRSGFSLVELAVVLTIIGLIVGGVFVGRDLVKAAELNSLTTDAKKVQAAVGAFRDKYQALPGDMRNATDIWGSLGGDGSNATCQNIKATGLPTCNGNGNGQVATNVVASDEPARFWQHLGNAGLIQGQYSGTITGYSPVVQVGVNTMASRLNGLGWFATFLGYTAGNSSTFKADYGHYMTPINSAASTLTLRPADAYQLDSKTDDGLPGSGSMLASKGTVANPCTDKANTAVGSDNGAKYNTSDLNIDCTLYYVRWF